MKALHPDYWKGYQAGIKNTVRTMLYLIAYVLHSKRGWKKDSILSVLGHIQDTFDSIDKGYETVEGVIQILRDEVDLNEFRRPKQIKTRAR